MNKKLLVINPDQIMEVQFDQQITIGRDVFNSLSVQDPEVSRSHAIIFEQDGHYIIKDLKSRNGVYVRGEKVRDATLEPGDEVILGSTVLIFAPEETLDLQKSLSRRGRFLVENRRKQGGEPRPAPAEIYPCGEMNRTLHTLFSDPDRTTFFTLDSAIALLQTVKEMDEAADGRELFDCALRRSLALLGGHRGVIMEADDTRRQLKVRAIVTSDEHDSIAIAQPILQAALNEENCICCPNVRRDPRFEKLASRDGRKIHSFAAVPVHAQEELFGFLYLDSEDESVSYDFNALRSLFFISRHLGSLLRVRAGHFARHARSEKVTILPATR